MRTPDASTTRLRRVTADDLDQVVEALVALEAELFDDPWDAAALSDLVAGWGRQLVVATEQGQGAAAGHDEAQAPVLGYVLTQDLGDFVDLLRIGVAPAARRRGLASELLTAAVGGHGRRVLLEVSEANAGARAFYAGHGFIEIDRRPGYYPDGSDALVLERRDTPGVDSAPDEGRMDP